MNTKFVIFMFISAFLVGAIFSSFTFVQFAFSQKEYKEYCATSPDGKRSLCYTVFTDTGKLWVMDCTKDSKGEWHCQLTYTALAEPSLPPGLSDALDTAIEESPNDTKVPKTGVLDDGGLKFGDGETPDDGGGSDILAEGDTSNDTKVPKDLGGLNNDNGPTINP